MARDCVQIRRRPSGDPAARASTPKPCLPTAAVTADCATGSVTAIATLPRLAHQCCLFATRQRLSLPHVTRDRTTYLTLARQPRAAAVLPARRRGLPAARRKREPDHRH